LIKTKLREIFTGLKKNDINFNLSIFNIGKNAEYRFLKKGETLFRIGDKSENFYLIIKGSLQILKFKKKLIDISIEEYLEYLRKFIQNDESFLVEKMLLLNRDIFYIEKKEIEINLENLFLIRLKIMLLRCANIFEIETFFERYKKKIEDYNLLSIYEYTDDNKILEYKNYLETYVKNDTKINLIEQRHFENFLINSKEIKKLSLLYYEEFLIIEEGNYFGDKGLDSNSSRNATITAKEDSHLVFVSKEIYRKYISKQKLKLNDEIIKFLYNSFFNKIMDKKIFELKHFSSFIYEEHYKNDILIRQNEDFKYVYFIFDGYIDLKMKKNLFEIEENIKFLIGIENQISREIKEDKDLYTNLKRYSLKSINLNTYKNDFIIKKEYTIKSISKNEIFGLENFYFNYPSFQTAIVTSKSLSLFKIEVKTLRNILKLESDLNVIKDHSINKTKNSIWRYFEIKKNSIQLFLKIKNQEKDTKNNLFLKSKKKDYSNENILLNNQFLLNNSKINNKNMENENMYKNLKNIEKNIDKSLSFFENKFDKSISKFKENENIYKKIQSNYFSDLENSNLLLSPNILSRNSNLSNNYMSNLNLIKNKSNDSKAILSSKNPRNISKCDYFDIPSNFFNMDPMEEFNNQQIDEISLKIETNCNKHTQLNDLKKINQNKPKDMSILNNMILDKTEKKIQNIISRNNSILNKSREKKDDSILINNSKNKFKNNYDRKLLSFTKKLPIKNLYTKINKNFNSAEEQIDKNEKKDFILLSAEDRNGKMELRKKKNKIRIKFMNFENHKIEKENGVLEENLFNEKFFNHSLLNFQRKKNLFLPKFKRNFEKKNDQLEMIKHYEVDRPNSTNINIDKKNKIFEYPMKNNILKNNTYYSQKDNISLLNHTINFSFLNQSEKNDVYIEKKKKILTNNRKENNKLNKSIYSCFPENLFNKSLSKLNLSNQKNKTFSIYDKKNDIDNPEIFNNMLLKSLDHLPYYEKDENDIYQNLSFHKKFFLNTEKKNKENYKNNLFKNNNNLYLKNEFKDNSSKAYISYFDENKDIHFFKQDNKNYSIKILNDNDIFNSNLNKGNKFMKINKNNTKYTFEKSYFKDNNIFRENFIKFKKKK